MDSTWVAGPKVLPRSRKMPNRMTGWSRLLEKFFISVHGEYFLETFNHRAGTYILYPYRAEKRPAGVKPRKWPRPVADHSNPDACKRKPIPDGISSFTVSLYV